VTVVPAANYFLYFHAGHANASKCERTGVFYTPVRIVRT
jgi:hypothetical protein